MSTPKTAGKILEEAELRAYIKCSEFYHRGGRVEPEFGLRVVQLAVEKMITLFLHRSVDPMKDIQASVLEAVAKCNQTDHLLEPQLAKYMSSCVLWIKELFDLFPFNIYQPVFGKVSPIVRISKTPIRVNISGIFRSAKNQTIHAVTFSPYLTEHAVKNDPFTAIKLSVLQPFVRKHIQSGRPQVVLHTFGYGKNHNMQYFSIDSNQLSATMINMTRHLVRNMEKGFHFPVIPCLFNCIFKKECFP